MEPVLLSPDESPTLAGLSGLLISGGSDVDPASYGQKPHESTDKPDADAEQHRVKVLAGVHVVNVAPDTKLAAIAGAGAKILNSRHHQAVDRLGRDLQVSARSLDGVVEALEDPGKRFVIAVHWQPEERIDTGEHDRRLFEAFAAALNG